MPDRAVVDDDDMPGFVPPHHTHAVEFEVQRVFIGQPIDAGLPEPQPRALSAVSEDRQWLVVLTPDEVRTPAGRWWDVWRRVGDKRYEYHDYYEDTGQDAHAVLAQWLEGRNGG